jgi:hypothetical protein
MCEKYVCIDNKQDRKIIGSNPDTVVMAFCVAMQLFISWFAFMLLVFLIEINVKRTEICWLSFPFIIKFSMVAKGECEWKKEPKGKKILQEEEKEIQEFSLEKKTNYQRA